MSELSEYEQRRLRNIEMNRSLLSSLGLHEHQAVATEARVHGAQSLKAKRPRTFTRKPRPAGRRVVKTRRSSRLRGDDPQYTVDDLPDSDKENDSGDGSEGQGERGSTGGVAGKYSRCLWMGKKQATAYALPRTINLPVTLCSIGTTVYALGAIYKGPGEERYWSNHQCLYRHPYPVGYWASKQHFGHTYDMRIEAGGEAGPAFVVEQRGGPKWTGPTPTQPWTTACLKSKSPGTRVSGPLFFGFSDPLIQHLIARLPGYEDWDSLCARLAPSKSDGEDADQDTRR